MSESLKKKIVCLACSSGGHLNQLIEIAPSLKAYCDVSFVTIDRPDTAQRLERDAVDFVPDLSKSNITQFFANLRTSFKLLKNNTPDIIITNGAGAVFLYVLLARFLFGVPIILVESFARIDGLSAFGKIVSLFARHYFVQWQKLERQCKRACYRGTVFNLPTGLSVPFPEQIYSVFVILGTTEFPFPRIVEWTEKAFQNNQYKVGITVQAGTTEPSGNIAVKQWMSHEEFIRAIDSADIVITHAGSGAIVNAVKRHKYTICVPRLSKHKEHNDNHQTEIADAFTELGYIKVAYSYEKFQRLLAEKETLHYPEAGTGNLVDSIIEKIAKL